MQKQNGNILFLILLAVVLFAALAYAVTSSMRGGGKDAGDEKARAQASALIQYGTLLKSTVMRTMLVNDVKEYGLDFSAGTVGVSAVNANGTCTNANCRVFVNSSLDGLMAAQAFGEDYIDPRWRAINPTFFGSSSGTTMLFGMVQVLDVGTTAPDVILFIHGLKPSICNAINDILWSTPRNYGDENYGHGGYSWGGSAYYSGTLTALPADYGIFGDNSAFFKGKHAGCIGRAGNGYGGDFYQVLIER